MDKEDSDNLWIGFEVQTFEEWIESVESSTDSDYIS